jgi:hypothetical protein
MEGYIGKCAGVESVTARGKRGEWRVGVDPWDFFLWPQYRKLMPLRAACPCSRIFTLLSVIYLLLNNSEGGWDISGSPGDPEDPTTEVQEGAMVFERKRERMRGDSMAAESVMVKIRGEMCAGGREKKRHFVRRFPGFTRPSS